MTTVDPDRLDRVVKLLVDADRDLTFAAAEELLRTYRLQVTVDAAASTEPAWQAAVLTIVNVGMRAVHGGVLVHLAEDSTCRTPWRQGRPLSEAVADLGGTLVGAGSLDPAVPTIVIGNAPTNRCVAPAICVYAGQWVATVAPATAEQSHANAHDARPSVLAAVLAAGLAVSECFQWLRGHAAAGDRTLRVSLWDPEGGADGPPITDLPAGLWLLGLGHLGQAYAWLLALLPYAAQGNVDAGRHLILQDDDRLSDANRATSMLHRGDLVATPKTRLTAAAMEPLGWTTALVERRYVGGPLHQAGDPAVLLGGVDNPQARRLLDDTGVPLIYDAGLGAGPDGYLAMTIRRLPGSRPSREIWAEPSPADVPAAAPPPLTGAAYTQLEAETGDRCGVERLAGRTVATAFVGVTAACWVIGGLLRELHGGPAYELVDLTLRDPAAVVAFEAPDARPPRVATVPAAT